MKSAETNSDNHFCESAEKKLITKIRKKIKIICVKVLKKNFEKNSDYQF